MVRTPSRIRSLSQGEIEGLNLRVRLTRRAQADLRAQIDWLTERSPAAAEKATARIFNALSLLADFPRSGHPTQDGVRDKPVKFGKFGFVIR